jgi:hypothetical protein
MNKAQNTGPTLPRTLKPSKWNLSVSSISPAQNDQKNQSLCFTKSFFPLDTDYNNGVVTTMSLTNLKDDPVNLFHTKRDMERLNPPVHVKNISNYFVFNKVLINITDQNDFTCRSTPPHIIIQLAGHQNLNKIIDHLHKTNASFHSYTPRLFRINRIIIRNPHFPTLSYDIINVLAWLGNSV